MFFYPFPQSRMETNHWCVPCKRGPPPLFFLNETIICKAWCAQTICGTLVKKVSMEPWLKFMYTRLIMIHYLGGGLPIDTHAFLLTAPPPPTSLQENPGSAPATLQQQKIKILVLELIYFILPAPQLNYTEESLTKHKRCLIKTFPSHWHSTKLKPQIIFSGICCLHVHCTCTCIALGGSLKLTPI